MNGENVHTVTVDYIEGVSVRADSYICSSLHLCVRSKFKERVFGLTVNGKAAKASATVKNGDVLQFELRPSADSVLPMKPAAEEIPLSVLYEDEFTLILDKPTGLTVHPAPGHFSGTLVNGLLSYLKEEESDDFEDENRPGIVHRLDKDTSGVILTAKTRAAADYYASLFRERKVQKEYRAFLRGILPSGEGKIERRLVRHRRDRKRFTVLQRVKTLERPLQSCLFFSANGTNSSAAGSCAVGGRADSRGSDLRETRRAVSGNPADAARLPADGDAFRGRAAADV